MITGLYAGLCGVLLLVVSARVIQRRLSAKIGLGAGGQNGGSVLWHFDHAVGDRRVVGVTARA
jgi:uncharacterized membrane protein YecN with MAPEG domain